MPPPFTWTGFYIGLNAGGIFSSGDKNATLMVPASELWLRTISRAGFGNKREAEFIGSGQAGYNWQTGAFVLGVVTDFDGTSLSSSRSFSSAPFVGARFPSGDTLNVNSKASLDWLGTTRAKIGFVATPDNRLMVYGTGGVAYGGGSSHFNVFNSVTNSFWSGSPSSTRVGWTVGAGVEYAFTNNWTIGGGFSTPTWAAGRSRRSQTPPPPPSFPASMRQRSSATMRRSFALL